MRDRDDELDRELEPGAAEGLEVDRTGHRPGLYLPDLTALSGWTWHNVDHHDDEPELPVGFRPPDR